MKVLNSIGLRLAAVASVAGVPLVLLSGCGTAVEPSAQAQQTVRPQRASAATATTAGLLGFSGIDAWYSWSNAAAVLTVVSLHKPEVALRPAVA